jgi:hypothetical protein
MNAYLQNFKSQIDALNSVYFELIKGIEDKVSLKNWWAFGAGTALVNKPIKMNCYVYLSQ